MYSIKAKLLKDIHPFSSVGVCVCVQNTWTCTRVDISATDFVQTMRASHTISNFPKKNTVHFLAISRIK